VTQSKENKRYSFLGFMLASEHRRIVGRHFHSLHPSSGGEKRLPEMRLQPPFFVRQTEIILQSALLFSLISFFPFLGKG